MEWELNYERFWLFHSNYRNTMQVMSRERLGDFQFLNPNTAKDIVSSKKKFRTMDAMIIWFCFGMEILE